MKTVKKTKFKLNILILFVGLLIHQSCTKEYLDFTKFSDEIENNRSISMPVAYGEFSAMDLIQKFDKKNKLNEYSDHLLYLVFEDIANSRKADSIIWVENNSFPFNFVQGSLGFPGTWTGTRNFSRDENTNVFNFNKSDRVIDKIVFDEGTFNLEVSSTFGLPGTITIEFPYVKNSNGLKLSQTVNIPTAIGGSTTAIPVSLKGYVFELQHDMNKDSNYLRIRFSGNLINNIGKNLTGAESINVQASFMNMDFSSMTGYLGKDTLTASNDSIRVHINLTKGTEDFHFEDPKVLIAFSNSIGVPTKMQFNYVEATYPAPKPPLLPTDIITPKKLWFVPGSNIYSIKPGYPTSAGQKVESNAKIDESNTDNKGNGYDVSLSAMLNQEHPISKGKATPDYLKYFFIGTTNPDATHATRNFNQFVTDSSKFEMKVGLELPLYGYTNNYELLDTQKLDLSGVLGKGSSIKSMMIRLIIDNGLPGTVSAQAFFTDSAYKTLDLLFLDKDYHNICASPSVDANGYVQGSVKNNSDIIIDGNRIENFQNVKHVIFKIKLSTFDAASYKNVKILSTNRIGVKLCIDADLTVSSNDIE